MNKTPNIDRLADGGARFPNSFCANSICTPSRATLLTGQYSHLNGVPVFNRFDGARDNVAKHLQAGGYHTGMIGKWHLGSDPTGFDRWIVLPAQGVYWNPDFLVPGRKITIAGHCTDITPDLGIEWLKTRPKDKPFFLMLHHKAPHRNWEPAERHIAMFKDKVFPEPDTLWDDYATRPAALPANQQTVAHDLTRRDLKLAPPADLTGPARQQWLGAKPTEVEVDELARDGRLVGHGGDCFVLLVTFGPEGAGSYGNDGAALGVALALGEVPNPPCRTRWCAATGTCTPRSR